MTENDKKLLIGILLTSLMILLLSRYVSSPRSVSNAVVKVQGHIVRTVDLNKNTGPEPITVQGKLGPVIIEVENKKIRISEARCPDQICVKQGWIDSLAQSIICVPNELAIYFDAKPPVDAITR